MQSIANRTTTPILKHGYNNLYFPFIIFLLFSPFSCTVNFTYSTSIPNCQSSSSTAFSFDPVPPSSHSLTFCQQYSSFTCCNSTQTNKIIKQLSPLFLSVPTDGEGFGVNDSCKNYAASIFCSPCDPFVGTGVYNSICESSCLAWYSACSSSFFQFNLDGILQPCTPSSLLCTNLESIFDNHKDFCHHYGFISSNSLSPSLSSVFSYSSSSFIESFIQRTLSQPTTETQRIALAKEARRIARHKEETSVGDDSFCFKASSVPFSLPQAATKTTAFNPTATTNKTSISLLWQQMHALLKKLSEYLLSKSFSSQLSYLLACICISFSTLLIYSGIRSWLQKRSKLRLNSEDLRLLRRRRFEHLPR